MKITPKDQIKTIIIAILIFFTYSCNKITEKDEMNNPIVEKDSSNDPSIIDKEKDVENKNVLVEKIKKVIITSYLQPEDLKVIDSTERKFSFYEIDVNNDGKKEVFINFFTPYFCGTGGCSLLLIDSNLNIINRFTGIEMPLYISPMFENGWNVIYVKSKGNWKALEYANGKYPSNPSIIENSKSEPDLKSTLIFNDQNESKVFKF